MSINNNNNNLFSDCLPKIFRSNLYLLFPLWGFCSRSESLRINYKIILDTFFHHLSYLVITRGIEAGSGLSACFQILLLMHREVLGHTALKHVSSSAKAREPLTQQQVCHTPYSCHTPAPSISSEKWGRENFLCLKHGFGIATEQIQKKINK